MDSNKTPLNSNSNVPNRGFTPGGGPNSGSSTSGGQNNSNFNSGNRNNYNRKKKQQRHFGPSPSTNPSNQAPRQVNAAGSSPNAPHPPRLNNEPAQGAPGGNNPPRPKPPYPQNTANPQRNPNAPYPAGQQQVRPQNRPANNANSNMNNHISSNNSNNNANSSNSNFQGQGSRNVPQPSVPGQNPAIQNPAQRNDRPVRKWENRMVKIEETFDDIRKDNERIEKEIWLEIAEIHNAKLD